MIGFPLCSNYHLLTPLGESVSKGVEEAANKVMDALTLGL